MDEIADLVHTVLTNTQPAAASKAKYTFDPGVVAKVAGRAGELLAPYPLYPAINLGAGAGTDRQIHHRSDATDR